MGAYNPKSLLRKASPALLAELFTEICPNPELAAAFGREAKIADVLAIWDGLPESARKRIESELREIDELAFEHGIGCIVEEAAHRRTTLPEEFQGLDGFLDRALWTRLKMSDLFKVAKLFSDADSQPEQSWKTSVNLPALEGHITKQQSDKVARLIGQYYVKKDMRGYRCSAERYRRGTKQYVFVYPDDYSSVDTIHDDEGQLVRTVNRRTLQLVFIYDDTRRTLDTFMKGGKKRQDDVIEIFTSAVFDEALSLDDPLRTPWALEKLLDPGVAFPVEAEDGLELARLQKLRVAPSGDWRRRVTFEADSKNPGDDVHVLMRTHLARYPAILSRLDVLQAAIQFVTRPNEAGKQERWSVLLTAPDRSNLRNLTERRQQLAEKYLERWGLDVAGIAAAASRRR